MPGPFPPSIPITRVERSDSGDTALVRVVTFNILNGRSPADGVVHPDRFVAAIARLRPDVLALQEVDRAQPRSGTIDFTVVAAETMGAVDSRFVAAVAGTPGLVWTAATGHEQPDAASYGVALLSRYPVRGWNVLRLPRLAVPMPVRAHHDRRLFLGRDEPRVAVTAEIDSPLGELAVTTTHLSFVPGWNARQLRRLMRALGERSCPQLLMGDLNMPPEVVSRRLGWRSLADAATFPAWRPTAQLDHVLSDRLVPKRPGKAVELDLSDHRALIAVL